MQIQLSETQQKDLNKTIFMKNKTKTILKVIAVILALIFCYMIAKQEPEAIILDKIQKETAQNNILQDNITLLEQQKLLSDEKLMVLQTAWDELGAGESINIKDLDNSLLELARAYDGEGKPYVPSGNRTTFLQNNASDALKDKSSVFEEIGLAYGVDPDLMVCIAFADSGLGKQLRTDYNYGNVGNTSSSSKSFNTVYGGIEAMAQALTNSYLGSYTMIGELSNGGRTALGLPACGVDGAYCYATSISNHNTNVISCMEDIKQIDIDETYNFRLN